MAYKQDSTGFGAGLIGDAPKASGRKSVGQKRDKETQKKRREYVRNRAKGLNKKDAALAAGFSPSMARNAAVKIETPEVLMDLRRAIEVAIPDPLVVQKIQEGIEAYAVQTAKFEGNITDEKAFPDFERRLKYLELRLELTGHLRRHGGD